MISACGRGVAKRASVVGPEVIPSPQPVVSGCVTPISGSLVRPGAGAGAGAELSVGTSVQWQLNLSGGCSTQYSLDGGRTLISNPYVFPKTYTQPVNGFREQLTVTAVYASGTVNPLPQIIISEPFNVTPPPAVAPLACNVIYPVASPTVPVDLNGNITSIPLPAYNFGVQLLRNNVAVAGRIVDVQSLNNPALPFALPTAFLPTPETANTMPVQLPIMFSKAGVQVLGVTVATATPAQTGFCVLVFNIMGQLPPPPVIRTFTASLTSVVEGANTIFSWTTGGTISACKLYGSIRGYSAELPLNGSLEVPIYQTETFRLSCREVDSDPITITAVPRPVSIALNMNGDNKDPNNPMFMSGQPNPPIFFQDLGVPGGNDYGQFFYPGVEITSFVSQQLGIDPGRCPQSKLSPEGATFGSYANISFSRTYHNGNPMAPVGNVGVFGSAHGGATTEVSVRTNFRTISLRSTFPRFGGVQGPFIFSNGFKVVLGLRSYRNINSYAGVINLVPGEHVVDFSNSMNVTNDAGLGGFLWKAECR